MKQIALLICSCLLAQTAIPPESFAQPVDQTTADDTDTGWPREISNNEQITIYEPQVEKWEGNRLEERAAVSVQTPASGQPTYGVIWISARTEIDKANHMVTLNDIQIPRASFPSDPAKSPAYLSLLRKNTPSLVKKIALDRLQANLAVTRAESKKEAPTLRNTPPKIVYSKTPAILVLVDGKPALRDTGAAGFLRVINTRSLLVLDQSTGKYYLYMGDRWMEASRLEGPWTSSTPGAPSALDRIKQAAVQQKNVDLLDDPDSPLMQELRNQVVPTVYVATGPAELIQTQGKPELEPISGTKLLTVKNTTDNIFLDTSDQNYYVLVSGRWYHAKSLEGPWRFTSARKLPGDFARIPESHPKASVLASVAGTPQAQEAGIANEIPQTATVNRGEPQLSVVYDGSPQFKPIEGTPLLYAWNTQTPVIEVDAHSFYAVQNGIWFVATSPQGPWVVATSVPSVIYSIPPSSPMYYVTYVRIYGYTPEVVYVGYTPGYLGSYWCSDGVVVFGTGYWYHPWIGALWVGPPLTYGFGWYWGVGFGWGFVAAAAFPWWGPWRGAWGRPGFPVSHFAFNHFNVNHFNIYRSWNRSVVRNSWERNAIATRNYTRRYGYAPPGRPNNLYAGRNGHVYRYNAGNWEEHGPQGWQRMSRPGQAPGAAPGIAPGSVARPQARPQMRPAAPPPIHELEQNRAARSMGQQRWNTFRGGGRHR